MVLGNTELKGSASINYDLFNYNMKAISNKRIDNYLYILRIIKEKAKFHNISILREKLNCVIAHNFPILLSRKSIRDHLYFQLNVEGYGVVSLYHSLIDEINE